jgi:hypothetical protein
MTGSKKDLGNEVTANVLVGSDGEGGEEEGS